MPTGYVLHNLKAGTCQSADVLRSLLPDPLVFADIAEITNYPAFFATLAPADYVVITGGDGTLNRFANDTEGLKITREILYFPNGTGNDFARDLGFDSRCRPFAVNEYLKNLPRVTVNGKTYRFINGVGYGIDGYCCEVGDKLKKDPKAKVNYTAIAIKGLLLHYKPTNATVTVDGRTRTYRKVWLAPTMHGRFYGGGMMPTPAQQRGSGMLSTMVMHSSGKLKTLAVFPSIFKGEHIKHTSCVEVLTGHSITVKFDRPVALQIDGETLLNVSSYTAHV